MPPDQNSRTAKAFLRHREVGDGTAHCRAHVMLYSDDDGSPVMIASSCHNSQITSLSSKLMKKKLNSGISTVSKHICPFPWPLSQCTVCPKHDNRTKSQGIYHNQNKRKETRNLALALILHILHHNPQPLLTPRPPRPLHPLPPPLRLPPPNLPLMPKTPHQPLLGLPRPRQHHTQPPPPTPLLHTRMPPAVPPERDIHHAPRGPTLLKPRTARPAPITRRHLPLLPHRMHGAKRPGPARRRVLARRYATLMIPAERRPLLAGVETRGAAARVRRAEQREELHLSGGWLCRRCRGLEASV